MDRQEFENVARDLDGPQGRLVILRGLAAEEGRLVIGFTAGRRLG